MPDDRWKLRDACWGCGLLAVFLLTRWAWLHDLPNSAFYWEEAYRWVAVEEIVSGPVRPLVDYQADHYQGGSLVAILLAVALTPLTGTGLSTLKLAALVFSGSTLLSLCALVGRFFGRTAGIVAGLVYVAGPPLVAFWGVVLMGFHSESVLPSLWLAYVTLALASGRWRGAAAWLLAGALAALSIWFAPTAAVAVAACAGTWLLLRGVPSLRPGGFGLLGFLIGSAPWLAYNASHAWAGLDRLLEIFGAHGAGDAVRSQSVWERAADLVCVVPGIGWLDPGGVLAGSPWRPLVFAAAGVPAGLGLLAAAVRWGRVARTLRRAGQLPDPTRLESVFWLHAVVFAASYLASHFTLEFEPRPIGFRLMVPSAVFTIPLLAISAARALEAGGAPRLLAALGTPLLLLGLGSATVALATLHEGEGTPLERERGYQVLGRLAERKHPGSALAALEEIRAIRDPDARRFACFGLGWGLLESYERSGTPEALLVQLASLPEAEREQVRTGLLWAARGRLAQVARTAERFDDPRLTRSRLRLEAIHAAVRASRAEAGAPRS